MACLCVALLLPATVMHCRHNASGLVWVYGHLYLQVKLSPTKGLTNLGAQGYSDTMRGCKVACVCSLCSRTCCYIGKLSSQLCFMTRIAQQLNGSPRCSLREAVVTLEHLLQCCLIWLLNSSSHQQSMAVTMTCFKNMSHQYALLVCVLGMMRISGTQLC